MAEEEEMVVTELAGSLQVKLLRVADASEDIMLLWALGQPHAERQNAFVRQSSESVSLDACGHNLTVWQDPSALNKPGVTGAVLWDSAIMLGKFLEHAHDFHLLSLRGKRCIELGAGCGFVGCVAALLGAEVTLTDLSDRLRLLQKNVDLNLRQSNFKLVPNIQELTWGEEINDCLVKSHVDYDVVYNEDAVNKLLCTLRAICSYDSTVILSAELRNASILEFFLESALKEFHLWRVPQSQWHPEFCSQRVAIYVMRRKQIVEE